MALKPGSYYFVRFKVGIDRQWKPGQVRNTNGFVWVALPYSMTHFGVSAFEFGNEIIRQE